MSAATTPASGGVDTTQPTNTNPTSGSFTFGNLGSWLTAATNGAGTILGALNNKTPSSPAAKAAASPSMPAWIWYAGGGLLLLLVLMIGLGHHK